MANYYTSCSCAFVVTTVEGQAFERLFDWLDTSIEATVMPAFPPDLKAAMGKDENAPDSDCLAALFWDAQHPFLAPHYTVDHTHEAGTLVEIWGDEIEPDSMAKILFHFARSALPLSFEWAVTCSRMRAESFGGGYAAVFPDRIEIKSTRELADAAVSPELNEHHLPLTTSITGYEPYKSKTLEDASRQYCEIRDESGLGNSEFADGVVTLHGIQIARISYNGKVWEPSAFKAGDPKPLYTPYQQTPIANGNAGAHELLTEDFYRCNFRIVVTETEAETILEAVRLADAILKSAPGAAIDLPPAGSSFFQTFPGTAEDPIATFRSVFEDRMYFLGVTAKAKPAQRSGYMEVQFKSQSFHLSNLARLISFAAVSALPFDLRFEICRTTPSNEPPLKAFLLITTAKFDLGYCITEGEHPVGPGYVYWQEAGHNGENGLFWNEVSGFGPLKAATVYSLQDTQRFPETTDKNGWAALPKPNHSPATRKES